MITGAHTIVYAGDAEATRRFFRDVLELPHVDDGGGWLIFALPPGELGVHPTEDSTSAGRHELYLTCDDIDATVRELTARGVEFVSEITDEGWGRLTAFRLPGGGVMGLYEPRHSTAFGLEAAPSPNSPAEG